VRRGDLSARIRPNIHYLPICSLQSMAGFFSVDGFDWLGVAFTIFLVGYFLLRILGHRH